MKKIITLLCFVWIICSCSSIHFKKENIMLIRSDGSKEKIKVELAISPEQQRQGFMERKKIPEGTGMLFIFDKDQIASFWMKNTPTALSIAYIDSTGKIRDILDMTPFALNPVVSSVSVRYALEVPQGWFKKVNITVGDYVEIPEMYQQ